MMRTVIGWSALTAMLASTSVASATGAAPSAGRLAPCSRLATYARGLKNADWGKKGDDALAPVLTFAKPEQIDVTDSKPPAPGSAGAVARLAIVKQALDNTEDSLLEVEHLSKSGLFEVDDIQGTLHCQNLAFLRGGTGGRPARVIESPTSSEGEGDLCWTTNGDLATLDGKPAFVVHDMILGTAPDDHIIVTPWTGAGWGAACETVLYFDTTIGLSEHYCNDAEVCRRATAVARAIVAAYDKKRAGGGETARFTYGPAAPAAVKAAIKPAQGGDTDTPDFPTFGAKTDDDHPLSYSGFAYFPLKLGDAWYGAAIAREGVGWRESDDTLLIVYDLTSGWTKPLASFVLPVSVTRLGSARAVIPKPPVQH